MSPVPLSLPMVLLRHTLPDGSHHFDWLLSRCTLEMAAADPDARDVITLRLDTRPDLWTPHSEGEALDAQQLPDHRRFYLTHEGNVAPATPGGPLRGRVERIAQGMWASSDLAQPLTAFRAVFADGRITSRRWSNGALRAT
jgi:hypothetical protein